MTTLGFVFPFFMLEIVFFTLIIFFTRPITRLYDFSMKEILKLSFFFYSMQALIIYLIDIAMPIVEYETLETYGTLIDIGLISLHLLVSLCFAFIMVMTMENNSCSESNRYASIPIFTVAFSIKLIMNYIVIAIMYMILT